MVFPVTRAFMRLERLRDGREGSGVVSDMCIFPYDVYWTEQISDFLHKRWK